MFVAFHINNNILLLTQMFNFSPFGFNKFSSHQSLCSIYSILYVHTAWTAVLIHQIVISTWPNLLFLTSSIFIQLMLSGCDCYQVSIRYSSRSHISKLSLMNYSYIALTHFSLQQRMNVFLNWIV